METAIIYLIITIMAIISAVISIVISIRLVMARNPNALKSSLSYLKVVPEISWVSFVGNKVFIGFNKPAEDMGAICRCAALNGHRAFGGGVHVYAVDASSGNHRTARRYCSATARRGKISKGNYRRAEYRMDKIKAKARISAVIGGKNGQV